MPQPSYGNGKALDKRRELSDKTVKKHIQSLKEKKGSHVSAWGETVSSQYWPRSETVSFESNNVDGRCSWGSIK